MTASSSVKRLPAGVARVEHVRAAQAGWGEVRRGGQHYTARVSGVEPLVECQGFFYVAIHERRLWRQYLRRRFRFELRSGVWLPGSRPPQNSAEGAYFTCATQIYDFYTRMFLAGLDAVDPAQREAPALWTKAAEAMREVLHEGLQEVVARDLHSPYEFQQEGAALSMAGYIGPQIRLYPSLWQALRAYGEPRMILEKRLPEDILATHRAGARGMSELLAGVRQRVNQTRQLSAKRVFHDSPAPVRERPKAHPHSKQHAPCELEEWYGTQELLQHLDALIPRAGLSPRQTAVLELTRAGLSHAAIASQLEIKLGSLTSSPP